MSSTSITPPGSNTPDLQIREPVEPTIDGHELLQSPHLDIPGIPASIRQALPHSHVGSSDHETTTDASATPGDCNLRAHGVYLMLAVEQILTRAGIICCVAGGKALRYYGANLATPDWQICVPDRKLVEAVQLFNNPDGDYEPGPETLPQIKSLLHIYPRFQPKEAARAGVTMTFWIMPASEWFIEDLEQSMIERSRSGVPYPKLPYFAQALVHMERWFQLERLVDGMDLSEAWGYEQLRLGSRSDAEEAHLQARDRLVSSLGDRRSNLTLSTAALSVRTPDRVKRWQTVVRGKRERISFKTPLPERYITQFRRKGSVDPRYREGRGV